MRDTPTNDGMKFVPRMFKKLLAVFLVLLLIPGTASAKWKMNPHTSKPDYYETGIENAPSDGTTYGVKNGVWSATGSGGVGDVLGPATNTADYLPQWNGTDSKTLKNGVAIPAGGLAGLTALGGKEDALIFTSPLNRATNTISMKGLTGFGSANQALRTNATADGLEWFTLGGGTGTVTSVSVTTANGVSGSVATDTTTPAITLSLGDITPSKVNALTLAAATNGFTISGGTTSKTLTVPLDASVSGTNTGDQTLASLGAQAALNGTGFVKASGTTISYDNSTYLTTEVDGSITNEIQNLFATIATTSGTSPVADTSTDTLTLTAGTGMTITGDSSTDAVTIATTALLSEVDGSITNELPIAGTAIDISGSPASTVDWDSTEVEATTWGAGAAATIVHTFNVSGTDTTMTMGSAATTFSGTLAASNLSGTNTGDTSGHTGLVTLDQTTPQTIINGNLSGSDPVSAQHFATKEYVDKSVTFVNNFYYNNTASSIGGIYYKMIEMPTGEAESSFSTAALGVSTGNAIVNFATDAGIPGVDTLQAGIYSAHAHVAKTAGLKTVNVYFEIYTRTTGGTETLRATSETSGEIKTKSDVDLHATIASDVNINVTDRVIIKWLANVSGVGTDAAVTLYAEGTNASHLSIPTSTEVLSSVFVRQDGTKPLTADWDAGTFEIRANTFESDVDTGTAPFVVASTTAVANLSIGGNAATVTTNANSTGDVTSVGNATTLADWSTGNVTYVPITGDIATYITNATAGDTLVLAAGTYTITSSLAINKLLHITGQGEGITTIACATDTGSNTSMLAFTVDGARLSNMTVSASWATTNNPRIIGSTASIDISNVKFLSTTTGNSAATTIGVRLISGGKTINIENCTYTSSGVIGEAYFVYDASSSTNTINIRNCYGIVSNTTATDGNVLIYSANAAVTINVYNSIFVSAVNKVGGIVNCSAGAMNIYNSILNGSGATAFDALQTAGTLTLYNTVLVGNKISGTITYGGTIKTLGLNSTTAGIGTTAPLRGLDVNEASGNCLRLIYNDSDGSAANYSDFLVSSGGNLTITPSGGTISTGAGVTFTAVAKGITLKQGANGKCGTFVANGLTPVTVSNTSIAITDTIIISLNAVGGTVGAVPAIQTITASTGFTVAATALDTSTYNYAIISNAA